MSAPQSARPRRFKQVDVFSGAPFKGNPLAVILDADGLDDAGMLAIARWTNLSETTFVFAPSDPAADYRVRIFSPGGEFPFAGHPTLGTAHALREHGLLPRQPGMLVQECGVGLVPVALDDGTLAFRAPEASLSALAADKVASLAAGLGTASWQACAVPVVARMGIAWLLVELPSAQEVLDLQAVPEALFPLLSDGVVGVALFGRHPDGAAADYEVRALFDKNGMLEEDPVTGSANACIAWWLAARHPDGYRARQGTCLERDGQVTVRYRDGYPWIGGQAVTVIDGTVLA